MQEIRNSLRNRVYYAAKDGMSLALYSLLVAEERDYVEEVLNEVRM